jgi:hypothetical protein
MFGIWNYKMFCCDRVISNIVATLVLFYFKDKFTHSVITAKQFFFHSGILSLWNIKLLDMFVMFGLDHLKFI